jgi:hypothetical protein
MDESKIYNWSVNAAEFAVAFSSGVTFMLFEVFKDGK